VLFPALAARGLQALRWATSAAAAAVILVVIWGEYQVYFVHYAATDRWPQPTVLGRAVDAQGRDTLTVTVAREYHQINSGWVRLMAPFTQRGGVESPGINLPITVSRGTNLTFFVFPKQQEYLPYLASLYPGGQITPITHPTEGLIVTTYRVPKELVASMQGATAQPATSSPVIVNTLGEPPPGVLPSYPAQVRWTAGLRAPRYWNYVFRVGPGPAKLTIDGVKVLEVASGVPAQDATVSMARGLHAVDYEGTLTEANKPALFMWGPEPERAGDSSQPADPPTLQSPSPEDLVRNMKTPTGLLGVVQVGAAGAVGAAPREQRRLDGTLATCCLSESTISAGREYTANWTGTLQAPASGVYSMTLLAQGMADLRIDGNSVIHIDQVADQPTGGTVELTTGPHHVDVTFKQKDGPSAVEWVWTPPGGATSIVPPSALSPPPGTTVGNPVSQDVLGHGNDQPTDVPPDTVP
jgi:hypothetical protein